jgi:putative component of membrane protein insertase Oxa1/YidC/SpoIIIJ protein YidD
MKRVAMAAIRFYQRCLSPYKGYTCAYGRHTGHASCSNLGLRAIRRHGVLGGWGILRRRLHLCGVVHRRRVPVSLRPPAAQRGDCDPGCDLPCDWACDLGSCDWPGNNRGRRRKKDDEVYVPPKTDRQKHRRDESRS